MGKVLWQRNIRLFFLGSKVNLTYKYTTYRFFFNYLKSINDFFEVMYLSKGASSIGAMDLAIDRYITGGVNSSSNFACGYEANLISNSINYYVGCTNNNYL